MTNINGRKAVITNRLQRWSSFEALANQLGYPDAAVPSEQDKRTRPQDGDVVTVLSSVNKRGETVMRDNQRVFIVEAANGERHIYGEKGLRILDEEVTGVTVLKDESLGGVEREYREVKRKAAVGERIKIVDAHTALGHYENGDIYLITRLDGDGDARFTGRKGSVFLAYPYEYVVLEPSDIIRINTPDGDGKAARFRTVDRKAAVGERVIVVASVSKYSKTGNTGKVISVGDADAFVDLTESETYYGEGKWYVDKSKYRVLEPVERAETTPISEPLSAKPAPDQAAEIIAKLTGRVTALEKRVAALETAEVTAETSRIALDPPVFSGVSKLSHVKSPQEIRDDIVKRAKEDMHELSNGYGNYIFREPRTRIGRICEVEFVVNRDKRKVTAILRGVNSRKVYAVGRAVCSMGDVFNVHLGRAISLRKAINQPIPTEYFEVPNPTEARIGDYVKTYGSLKFTVTQEFSVLDVTRLMALGGASIIDDSREDESDSAEPRKEVA